MEPKDLKNPEELNNMREISEGKNQNNDDQVKHNPVNDPRNNKETTDLQNTSDESLKSSGEKSSENTEKITDKKEEDKDDNIGEEKSGNDGLPENESAEPAVGNGKKTDQVNDTEEGDVPGNTGRGKEEEKIEVDDLKSEKKGSEEKKISEIKDEEHDLKLSSEETSEAESEKDAEEESVKGDKGDITEPQEKDKPAAKKEKGKKKTEKASKIKSVKVQIPKSDGKSGLKEKYEITDYSGYSEIELVNAMRDLLEGDNEKDIKREIETIRSTFYKKLKEEYEKNKKKFLEEGGEEEDYMSEENPYEKDIKDLLKRYRQQRIEFNKKLEEQKELNLQLKYEVIEEIKGLIHKEESINKTFQDFRELQKRWREIGLVPQSKVKDLWDTYHFHVENFYDYIKINQELRDLDLKKNLEMKIRLCEQAEELLLEPNIIRAFHALQKLHERWREIGPVPREHKDDIWERFKVSTTKINRKHQDYFENRKAEQRKNFEAKQALCEQVEEINELELTTHKEWSEKSKEIINLQKVWRTIGFAPRKDNTRIYNRFRSACDKFFDAKREFYAQNKELQQNNLQMKIDLCIQAEALKDSTDWRKTTQDLINIQKQWKEIGPVPRKNSESVWIRFRAACDYFFDKKSEHFSNIDAEQVENLNKKEKLIEEVKNFEPSKSVDENLEKMKDFQRRWTEIGHVPIKQKDVVQKEYREAINKLFDELNIDESERNLLKFKTKMASFSESSSGQDKMRVEREKYMNKLKQHENDLVLLDNNIGFFAKSKKTESLIKDVKRKIEETKSKIEFLKEKIRVIDEMDRTED
jgi:hypothetical protein